MITTISASRAARVRTGQLVSTDDELARSISAGRWWNRQRDLVDIVGWEDFAFASERAVPPTSPGALATPRVDPRHQAPAHASWSRFGVVVTRLGRSWSARGTALLIQRIEDPSPCSEALAEWLSGSRER